MGQCSLDVIGKIEDYPQPDAKCEFTGMVIQGGGPVASALVALSRWGMPCAFCGVTGDDLFGGMIRDALQIERINIENLALRTGSSSQFAFIAAEPARSRRTIFWQRPGGAPLAPEEVDSRLITGAKMLHTDGLFIEAALHCARIARRNGVPVSVDAGSLREGMLELARLSDYFIASESFARQLLGRDGDPEAACREIARLGPRVSGVTLGAKGYVWCEGGAVMRRPAYLVKAVDTTGCGDVFHAGFIFGILKGLVTERSLDIGAWAASRVSLALGGRSAIPSREEMESRQPARRVSELLPEE